MTPSNPMTKIVRPLRSGQITIPAAFRKSLGIDEHSVLKMTLDGGELRLTPVQVVGEGSSWFRELYDLFVPVRQEAVERGYSEEEINDWIDAAVQATRSERRAKPQ